VVKKITPLRVVIGGPFGQSSCRLKWSLVAQMKSDFLRKVAAELLAEAIDR
jgi:hypothetical protein